MKDYRASDCGYIESLQNEGKIVNEKSLISTTD